MSEKSSGGFWAVFGKISAVLTAAATVVGLYLAINPNGPDLVAKCNYNSYSLPPDLINTIEKVKHSESSDAIAEEMKSIWNETNTLEQSLKIQEIAPQLSRFLEAKWTETFIYRYFPYRGFWYFTIQNSGNRIASDVELAVPLAGIALVTGRDEAQKVQAVTGTIPLGSLRPGDSIAVALWSEQEGTWYDLSGFRLTHAGGVGVISFPSSFYGFRAIVARNLGFICFMGVVAALCVVLIILGTYSEGRKAEEPTEQQAKKEGKSQ